ncbi:hypothetical protein AALA98_13335 [Lachnospiraceae bacterium 45-W7]
MLEIESTHIEELNDSMLRKLIGLLCEEELTKSHINVRKVFWGGHQNAADGGIDVRCEYEGKLDDNSFIPRNKVGFQVKLCDLKPKQILTEMRDKSDELKESIQELCREKGAYILVCGKSSVTDIKYQNRIDAMKEAVRGYLGAESVCLDFMDGNRIATWVRSYPALIVWVREKISRPLQGWQAYGKWSDIHKKSYKNYILDQEKRMYDYIEDQEITILEGIQRLRNLIRNGSAIIRITGLSGVGKTRMIEALFDKQIGTDALNSSKVIYADAAENLVPSAEQMLREIIFKNAETTLIMDNCSAELHARLMAICRIQETRVSLITVEYDVKDKYTEETASFLLRPASDSAIQELLAKNYTALPFATINRIVEISGGNARLALIFAKSLSDDNRDITMITNSELFKRLFWQKGSEDKELYRTAKTFSLLYSVDYEDEKTGSELEKLSALSRIHLRQSVEYLEELKNRDLLQTRGKWCAILPHALSNYLAKEALQSYRKDALKMSMIDNGTDRMKMSFAHRLSFLYDDKIVQEIAEQWLDDEFTDLSSLQTCQIECFYHLAKINPKRVMECIKKDWKKLQGYFFYSNRINTIISTLAYYPDYFIECMELMITKEFHTVREADIEKYFQHTDFMNKKCADERLRLIKQWIQEDKKELGLKCLQKTLEKGYGTELAYREFPDFNQVQKENAKENEDYWFDVFSGYIEELVIDENIFPILITQDFTNKIFQLINQGHISNVERIATNIREKAFWREGYIEIMRKLSGKIPYPNHILIRMQAIKELLEPKNLEEEILYWCLSYTHEIYFLFEYSFEESCKMHNEKLAHYGKLLAKDFSLFQKVYKQLVLSDVDTIQLGKELAKSSDCNLMWNLLCDVLRENKYIPERLYLLMGILSEQKNMDNIKEKLGVLSQDARLIPAYIVLVISRDCFANEMKRFHKVVKNREVDISKFYRLSVCQSFLELSIERFMDYMQDFAKYDNCDAIIWNLIAGKVKYEKKIKGNIDEATKKKILIFLSNERISIYNTSLNSINEISYIKTVIALLCHDKNVQHLKMFYNWLKDDIEEKSAIGYDIDMILDELYKQQPILFLDVFIENSNKGSNILRMIKTTNQVGTDTLSKIHSDILISWCNKKPDQRYYKIFDYTYGYEQIEGKYQWKKIAFTAMKQVKDRKSLALKLIESISLKLIITNWGKEREAKEILFDLFVKDKDKEIAELALREKKEYSEITEQLRKDELAYQKNIQRFE